MSALSSILPASYRDNLAGAFPTGAGATRQRPEPDAPTLGERAEPEKAEKAESTKPAAENQGRPHPLLESLQAYYAQQVSSAAPVERMTDMVTQAVPARGDGAVPVVSADQRQLIQSIAGRMEGRGNTAALMNELAAHGVHPGQIAAGAQLWSYPDGRIVDQGGGEVAPARRGILV